jgi:two-component system sensor histidine kinase TctE
VKAIKATSLKRRLIARLLFFHSGILLLFGVIFVGYLVRADEGGVLVSPEFARVAAQAISRAPDGRLRLWETDELAALRHNVPDFWFVARNDRGEVVTTGEIPEMYRSLAQHLDRMTFADIRDTTAPFSNLAIIRRASGPAGEFTVLGKGDLFSMTFVVLFLSNLLMIPILGLLAVVTLVATPLIVRRALAGLSVIADEAGRIDIDRRGHRLSATDIPLEVAPLVGAVNGALQRLDEGYDRHQRFIVDAAHELRTPIAILQAKIEASGDRMIAQRFGRDVARLATLAEQLLDLQRIGRTAPPDDVVNLGAIARRVAADLAPLAIAHGRDLEVVDLGAGLVRGDPPAIERVLTNLIQNAIEHGGCRVVIRVDGPVIDVEDDGPGIPIEERDMVFEPFHRLRARQTGAGLGLNLVRQVMDRHGGWVEALDAPGGGTIMRLEFVAAPQP